MALFTPEQAARSTLAALRYLSVLPRTVRQDFSTEFVAGRGQTVNVLGPVTVGAARTYTAANRAARAAIVFDAPDQELYPVTLEDQVYKAVRLPDDWATFTLQSLEQQVLRPSAEAVVDSLAAPLITEMEAIDNDATNPVPDIAADGSNFRAALIAARRVLNGRKVPMAGRVVAVGANIEAAALSDENLQKVNESGTSDTLREAIIGRLFGFTIVAANDLDDDFGIAYHADAFAHVTRPSRQPEGAAYSAAVAAEGGFALRHIMHYNPLQLEDQSVVDTFVGAATLDADRAVSFTMAAS